MKRITLSIVLICLFFFLGIGQVLAQAQLKKANDLYDQFAYTEAIELYTDFLKKEKKHPEATAKIADCYRLTSNPRKAAYWYRKAVRYNPDEHLLKFYYAQALMSSKRYEEAAEWFQKYTELVGYDSRGWYFLESCKNIDELMKDSSMYIVKKIRFNSKESDFGPAFLNNGLVFASGRENKVIDRKSKWTGESYISMFYTAKDGYKWKDPVELAGKDKTPFHEGPACFTRDGRKMYFTRNVAKSTGRKAGTVNLKIFEATWNGSKWTNEQALNFNSDHYSSGHPAVSSDGRRLYFTSDKPGGFGGKDLYVSERIGAKWGKPVNLGKSVNTEGDEMFPSILDDGTLYFASDGLGGFGGLDIFAAIDPYDFGDWQISNAGYPINGPRDDFGLILTVNKREGYFASNRGGNDDIYQLSVTETKAAELAKVVHVKPLQPPTDEVAQASAPKTTTAAPKKTTRNTTPTVKYAGGTKPPKKTTSTTTAKTSTPKSGTTTIIAPPPKRKTSTTASTKKPSTSSEDKAGSNVEYMSSPLPPGVSPSAHNATIKANADEVKKEKKPKTTPIVSTTPKKKEPKPKKETVVKAAPPSSSIPTSSLPAVEPPPAKTPTPVSTPTPIAKRYPTEDLKDVTRIITYPYREQTPPPAQKSVPSTTTTRTTASVPGINTGTIGPRSTTTKPAPRVNTGTIGPSTTTTSKPAPRINTGTIGPASDPPRRIVIASTPVPPATNPNAAPVRTPTPVRGSVLDPPNIITPVNVATGSKFILIGIVLDRNSKDPISNSKVELQDARTKAKQTYMTNHNGNFYFSLLPNSEYNLFKISKEGQIEDSKTVSTLNKRDTEVLHAILEGDLYGTSNATYGTISSAPIRRDEPSFKTTDSIVRGAATPKPKNSIYKPSESYKLRNESDEGMYFRVQIGAFNTPVSSNSKFLDKVEGDVETEKTENGLVRYVTGRFEKYEAAAAYGDFLKIRGYDNAFVAAYFNGYRLEMSAEQLKKMYK